MPKRTPLILLKADPDPIHAAQGCKVSAGHRASRYPMVNIRRRGRSTTMPMVRYILGLYRGRALRRGDEAMHSCDHPPCAAREHLSVWTRLLERTRQVGRRAGATGRLVQGGGCLR